MAQTFDDAFKFFQVAPQSIGVMRLGDFRIVHGVIAGYAHAWVEQSDAVAFYRDGSLGAPHVPTMVDCIVWQTSPTTFYALARDEHRALHGIHEATVTVYTLERAFELFRQHGSGPWRDDLRAMPVSELAPPSHALLSFTC